MNEPTTTISGNLTADPELRYTTGGQAVASFTIACTPRYRDSASGEWRDGETWFCRCSAWRDLGENIAASLQRGTAVIATGKLRAHSWQTEDGAKRTAIELTVDDLGPSLKRATAKVIKTTREHATDPQTPPPGTAGEPRTEDSWRAPSRERGSSTGGDFPADPPWDPWASRSAPEPARSAFSDDPPF